MIGVLDALPPRVPVVISGGGPSGLFLALDLAARGVESLVIETREEVDPYRPRAKTTNARTMSHLRRLGLAAVLRAAAPVPVEYAQDVIFCSSLTGHEVRRFPRAFQLVPGRYDPAPECGQQVPQPVVEEVLRDAVARSGLATLCTGASVRSFAPVDTGYSVTIGATGAPEVTVRTEYIAACDGGSSTVRKNLGIPLEGSSAARSNLSVLFRSAQLGKVTVLDRAVQYWVMNPKAAGMVGRLDLEQTWWAILQGVDPDHLPEDPADLVRTMVGADVDIEIMATDPWTARMLVAREYGRGGVFLVGDAAHLNPPWGGHGFNTCIGDAANLAWKLAGVLQGWGSPRLLDTYGPERRPVAIRTIRDADANGNALAYHFADSRLDDDGEEGFQAREGAYAALGIKRSEFHSLGLVLGYGYPDSSLVAAEDTPLPAEDPVRYRASARPGSLLPHIWLADGTSVYDRLGRGFTLLFDAEGDAANRAGLDPAAFSSMRSAADALGLPLSVVPVVGPAGCPLRTLWEAPAVLVRPDQHVAWRGDDVAVAAAFLPRAAGWTHTETALNGAEHGDAVIS